METNGIDFNSQWTNQRSSKNGLKYIVIYLLMIQSRKCPCPPKSSHSRTKKYIKRHHIYQLLPTLSPKLLENEIGKHFLHKLLTQFDIGHKLKVLLNPRDGWNDVFIAFSITNLSRDLSSRPKKSTHSPVTHIHLEKGASYNRSLSSRTLPSFKYIYSPPSA